MYSLALTALLFAQGPQELPDFRGEAKPSRPPVAVPPKIFEKTITHPDNYLKLAIAHMKRLPEVDRFYTRFFLFNQAPEPLLPDFTTCWGLYYNTVNPASILARFREVNGSDKRLFAFDLRATRLSVEAFAFIVRKDQALREPEIDHDLAEELRRLAGIQQDPETFACDVIVRALWLMRDVIEPGNRNSSMYDMLYPDQRFGKSQFKYAIQTATPTIDTKVGTRKVTKQVVVPWKGGVWPNDGKFYEKGAFTHFDNVEVDEPIAVQQLTVTGQQKIVVKLVKDFPENLDQFQDFWGVTDSQKILDKQYIFAKRGEIIAGSRNNKVNGSIVAYNDRFFEVLVLAGGFPYARTWDFKKTSGIGNIINNPRGVALGDITEDAGEHLQTLPCGLQTAFLTGAAKEGRKRVEAGDAEVVYSSKDKSLGVVKTQFSCTLCHGEHLGFHPASNSKVKEGMSRGIRLLDVDPDKRDGIQAFFFGWEEDMDYWRLPYKKALRSLTQTPDDLGWDGKKFATVTQLFRDWYDAPLGLDQVAAEMGVPKFALMLIVATTPILVDDDKNGSFDLPNLLVGGEIPRPEFDDVIYRKLALAFSIARDAEKPNLLLKMFYPELLRQVATKGTKK